MRDLTIEDFKRWGAQGGKTKGISKVRGDSEYYRTISKKRKGIKEIEAAHSKSD